MTSATPSPAVPSGEATQNTPAPTPHRDHLNPWLFARTWALYIVYIVPTRYKGTGGFKGALLPSQSPKFLNDHVRCFWLTQTQCDHCAESPQADALARGDKVEKRAKDELEGVKIVVLSSDRVVCEVHS